MAATEWGIGQQVQVQDRTWTGINKEGGHGKIVKIHYTTQGLVDKLDVRYTLGRKAIRLDTHLVENYVALERSSRRGRNNPKEQGKQATKKAAKKKGKKKSNTRARRRRRERTTTNTTTTTRPRDEVPTDELLSPPQEVVVTNSAPSSNFLSPLPAGRVSEYESPVQVSDEEEPDSLNFLNQDGASIEEENGFGQTRRNLREVSEHQTQRATSFARTLLGGANSIQSTNEPNSSQPPADQDSNLEELKTRVCEVLREREEREVTRTLLKEEIGGDHGKEIDQAVNDLIKRGTIFEDNEERLFFAL